MTGDDHAANVAAIRDGLSQFDPETRHQVIETMRAMRTMPRPAAVRILADAAMRGRHFSHLVRLSA